MNEFDKSGKQVNRAQTGTGVQRRFQTQKNSRMYAGVSQPNNGSAVMTSQSIRPQQELLDLGSDILDQLDEETLMKISEIQKQLQSREGNLDKSQIMHLYRMSIGRKQTTAG